MVHRAVDDERAKLETLESDRTKLQRHVDELIAALDEAKKRADIVESTIHGERVAALEALEASEKAREEAAAQRDQACAQAREAERSAQEASERASREAGARAAAESALEEATRRGGEASKEMDALRLAKHEAEVRHGQACA